MDKRSKLKKYKNKKYIKHEDNFENDKSEDLLPNNWSRYEVTDKNDDCSEGADFETLLSAPVSSDSYFKFKSEQNWDEDIKSQLDLNKYFMLDLKLLNEGISSIPFTKRHDFEDSLFSQFELESIKKKSDSNAQKYNRYLIKKFPKRNNQIIIKKNSDVFKQRIFAKEVVKATSTVSEITENNQEIKENKQEIKENNQEIKEQNDIITDDNLDDRIDDLLNFKETDHKLIIDESVIKAEDPLLEKTEIKVAVPQLNVDLEQWLDDILDD